MQTNLNWRASALLAAIVVLLATEATAQRPETDDEVIAEPAMIPAPDRRPGEGQGPYDRLVIRGATLIDGTGAPTQTPAPPAVFAAVSPSTSRLEMHETGRHSVAP